jgi:hypothetical protein
MRATNGSTKLCGFLNFKLSSFVSWYKMVPKTIKLKSIYELVYVLIILFLKIYIYLYTCLIHFKKLIRFHRY